MSDASRNASAWNQHLSDALRAIRRRRGLSPTLVAQRMDKAKRTYEHFEAGGGKLNVETVYSFAAATDSDPLAILAAVFMGSPQFAVRSADNKLVTLMLIALQEFDEELGADIAELDAHAAFAAFSQAFETLKTEARARKAWRETFLRERGARLGRDGQAPSDAEDSGQPDD